MAAPSRERTETTSDWPEWLKPAAQHFAQLYMQSALDENGQLRPMPEALNQLVAPLQDIQQRSISNIADFAGDESTKQMIGAAGEDLTKTFRGDYLNPETNPYLRQTYDAASRALTDEYSGSTAPTIMSEALRAKAFGSSAHQEYADRAKYQLGQNLSDLATSIYGGNYSQERDRQLTAQQLMPAYQQSALFPQQAAFEASGTRQSQQQLEYDTALQNALRREDYPYATLDRLGGGLQTALGPAQQGLSIGRARPGGIGATMGLK